MSEFVTDRFVVVTGAANGIGFAIARQAIDQGADTVAVLDIDAAAAEAAAGQLGPNAVGLGVDVADRASLDSVAESLIAQHGTPGLVCANAGVSPDVGPLLETPVSEVDWVLSVNVSGVLNTLQAFGTRMVASPESGWLLATGSEHSLGVPHTGAGIYTASKHAVLAMSDIIRRELPDHVGISVLCPGLTESAIWNSHAVRPGRFGGPVEGQELGKALFAKGMAAETVADRALAGVERGDFVIPTHYNARDYAEARATEVAGAFDRLGEIDQTLWHVDDKIAEVLSDL